MSGFYTDWLSSLPNDPDSEERIRNFLASTEETLQPLLTGPEEELQAAFSVLKQMPFGSFLAAIRETPPRRPLTSADIPCFSNLKDGASRLNEVLLFHPDGLTIQEAGFELMGSKTAWAKQKYGENHSKLAALFRLVTFTPAKSTVVKPSAWGNWLTAYGWDTKKPILQRVLLQDICIQTILHQALNGTCVYRNLVSFLSLSTIRRRRSNVKSLIEFLLVGNEWETRLCHIDWEA